ncbi:MAG: preprotein translocase subunit SecG, partial [Lachnospiraceae bacterium]
MGALRIVVTILYIIICIALTVIVLMQEGKSAGLTGAISGVADSYWGKNKGRSMEGTLEKITRILAILF